MNIELQAEFLKIIDEDFQNMKRILDRIHHHITQYPVYTQLEFIEPIKHLLVEACSDACDPDNKFLNNCDGGDKIEIAN